MSLMKCTLAAMLLSASPALADDAPRDRVAGVWEPVGSDTVYTPRTVLVFNGTNRFAAFLAVQPDATAADDGKPEAAPVSVAASRAWWRLPVARTDRLYAASGTWNLAEDGGELVLAFDSQATSEAPGSTLYVQMLLLGDELRPYPGMARWTPIAGTSWRKVE